MQKTAFFKNSWCRFAHDPALAGWIRHTLPVARTAVTAPQNAKWLRYGGTWFAGVNALDNDATGAVTGGPPLAGAAVDFIHGTLGLEEFEWDRAQVSVCYRGYPKPVPGEAEAAFRYRRNRDAAHVDGLRRQGTERRRFINEHHGFLLAIPMVEASPDASPFVVWQGSHEIIRDAFQKPLKDRPPADWKNVDMTDVYHTTRRKIFDTCERLEIACKPGEAYIVHRLALHGMAPWTPSATAGPDGRMIVYFRPQTGGPGGWLNRP